MDHIDIVKKFDDIHYRFKELEWKLDEIIKRVSELETQIHGIGKDA